MWVGYCDAVQNVTGSSVGMHDFDSVHIGIFSTISGSAELARDRKLGICITNSDASEMSLCSKFVVDTPGGEDDIISMTAIADKNLILCRDVV